MANSQCRALQRWLITASPTPQAGVPAPELVAHSLTCPACRGLIATAAAAIVERIPPRIDCVACEQDLDAFIDVEERAGAPAAARRYPQIWWHLLTCAECADVYAGVHALLHAEATGALSAPPLTPVHEVFRLARSYLHAALAPQVALGVGWGAEDAQQLAADRIGPYEVALAAYPTDDTTVTFLVQIEPPASGTITLRLNPLVVRAAFGADGTALVPDVPIALLAAATDDVSVDLELDELFD